MRIYAQSLRPIALHLLVTCLRVSWLKQLEPICMLLYVVHIPTKKLQITKTLLNRNPFIIP